MDVELSMIKNILREKIQFVFIASFKNAKNVEILISQYEIINYNLIKDDEIADCFANFQVPVMIYNDFYFIPMRSNLDFSLSIYKSISKIEFTPTGHR